MHLKVLNFFVLRGSHIKYSNAIYVSSSRISYVHTTVRIGRRSCLLSWKTGSIFGDGRTYTKLPSTRHRCNLALYCTIRNDVLCKFSTRQRNQTGYSGNSIFDLISTILERCSKFRRVKTGGLFISFERFQTEQLFDKNFSKAFWAAELLTSKNQSISYLAES